MMYDDMFAHIITAIGTNAFHKAVSQKEFVIFAISLVGGFQTEKTVLMEAFVNSLGNLSMFRRRSTPPFVEADLKPSTAQIISDALIIMRRFVLVNLRMQFVEFGTEFVWGDTLF